jgi:hypothetical protein
MKYLIAFPLFLLCFISFGQDNILSKPTIMVFPDDAWMTENRFITSSVGQGASEGQKGSPDYKKAFREDKSKVLSQTTRAIEKYFTDNNFTINSLEDAIKELEQNQAANAESDIVTDQNTMILSAVNPDIKLEFTYSLVNSGFGWTFIFSLSAKDVYTSTPIATIQSESMTLASQADILPAIQRVIKTYFPELMLKLTNHWNNVANNGLQVKLRINLSSELVSGKNINFESRIGEDAMKLQEILTKWVSLNAKNKRYSIGSQTKNVINYNSINIPLETPDKSGKNNAKLFAEQLVTHIYKTLKFDGEVSSSGPGNATIILK